MLAVWRVVAVWMGFVSFNTQLEIKPMNMIVRFTINQYMTIRTRIQRLILVSKVHKVHSVRSFTYR
jgi:hypothetical protein